MVQCIRANMNNRLGIRAQSFAYTRTIVWAYANDNNPAPNSLLPGTKLPERAGVCTTSDALSIKGRGKGQKEMQVVAGDGNEGYGLERNYKELL